jgi:taurine dioxygenase
VPGSPEIVIVSNVTEAGQPIGVRRAGENWHSDMCYAPRPPRGTMLYALEIPDLFGLSLGNTEFASAAAAWDALPEQLRPRVEGRRAVFDFSGRKRAFPPKQSEIDRYPPLTHPIVRTHPYTLRKCLYVMRDDCTTIEGIDPEEAAALIAALAEHIVKPAFIYRHQWRRGDLLMWDNCTVQHRAIQDYDLPHRRLMHRTTMGGAVPV